MRTSAPSLRSAHCTEKADYTTLLLFKVSLQGVPPAPPPFKKADERLRRFNTISKSGNAIKGAGLRVEIFDRREKIQPVPLDVVERHTYPQGTGAKPCPSAHGECGVWGEAPLSGRASHARALSGAIPTG